MKVSTTQEAYEWAAARCARRECCRHELAEKLREAPLSRHDIEAALDRLEDERFVDHERYARAFVYEKAQFAQWGRVKIRQALSLKKISRTTIQAALEEVIDPAHYAETLRTLLTHKLRSITYDASDRQERYKASQKLARFALSRGYESDLIFSTLDDVFRL